jgi:hypothetical protein
MQLYLHSPIHLHGIQSNKFAFTLPINGSATLLLSPCNFVRLPYYYQFQETKTNENRCQRVTVIFLSVKLKKKCSFIVIPHSITCLDDAGFSQRENSKFYTFIGPINCNKSKFYA